MNEPHPSDPVKHRPYHHNLAVNNLTSLGLIIVFGFILHDLIHNRIVVNAADTTPTAQPLASAASSAEPPTDKIGSQIFLWENLKFAPSATGARVTMFDAPTPTLDKFHCHISTLNPGANTGALHRHPQEEFIVIKEGTLEVNIDGKKQTATPGSMIFYAANENENMTNIGKIPATYYVIQFYTALTPKS
jgi:quercetin dioxygenase-like cupin family protein